MPTKKPKILPEHKDILGHELALGNYVAIARHNAMVVCSIRKMTPKQMRVLSIHDKRGDGWLVYPHDTVLLSGEDALAYVLKH
jgi:hypothetical protein